MSTIEQLKKEAAELEARQRALGHPLKHCEALEEIARKHGYSNWRACRAMLGDETPESSAESGAELPVKRYENIESNFALDIPADWNVFPPVLTNSAYETVRFASQDGGSFHLVIVFRTPRDPKQAWTDWLAIYQRVLERKGFGHFRMGEVPARDRVVRTLDFDKPQESGNTWSVRHHFFEAGTLGYVVGVGSNAPEKIERIRARMVQSFELLTPKA